MRFLAILMVFAFCLSGCNTIEGMGKDLQKGGQAIENAAK